LTAEHAAERTRLFLGRCTVQHDAELPSAIGHDRWSVEYQGKRQPAYVDSLDVPALDVEREHRKATVVSGVSRETGPRTRTNRVARAILEVRTFQGPGHDRTPNFVPASEEYSSGRDA